MILLTVFFIWQSIISYFINTQLYKFYNQQSYYHSLNLQIPLKYWYITMNQNLLILSSIICHNLCMYLNLKKIANNALNFELDYWHSAVSWYVLFWSESSRMWRKTSLSEVKNLFSIRLSHYNSSFAHDRMI